MHGWETRMLLKHYLDRGVSKAELSRRFGLSRRTIHEWVVTGQLDRDLSSGGSRYSPRSPVPHKLDRYTGIMRISEEVEHRFRPKWNIDFGGSGTAIPGSGTRISGCGTSIPGEVERWFRSRERSSVA